MAADTRSITPAHLDYLSIFSPDLAEDEQLVFHYSKPPRRRRSEKEPKDTQDKDAAEARAQQEQHRRMRQIGLAQGMVGFARTFSGGKDVDSVESEKHRIVLKELEKGWWILASIRLTCIRTAITTADTPGHEEHSAREVSAPLVLIQQLLSAHRIFALHHCHSLSDLYVRLPRARFCTLLEKYWSPFAASWDVMLHGNPTADAIAGVRLAGAGELGVGVGEEDWGSAEREYLEELTRTTDGLVDMVVYRSGSNILQEPGEDRQTPASRDDLAEGLIFSGLHTLGRHSLRALTEWMRLVSSDTENAYGVADNPLSSRARISKPRAKRQMFSSTTTSASSAQKSERPAKSKGKGKKQRPAIPPPLVPSSTQDGTGGQDKQPTVDENPLDKPKEDSNKASLHKRRDSESWMMRYLTLGYGTTWMTSEKDPTSEGTGDPKDDSKSKLSQDEKAASDVPEGRFLVGLTGPLTDPTSAPPVDDTDETMGGGNRLSLRTVHVEINEPPDSVESSNANPRSTMEQEQTEQRIRRGSSVLVRSRLRLVLYAHEPFTYALLFRTDAASLSMQAFYYELHKKLQPLHKALSASTAPERIVARILSALPRGAEQAGKLNPIYDLMYDPDTMMMRTTIPNIPSYEDDASIDTRNTWSRLEGLSVHMHILALLSEAFDKLSISERSVKTSRNWWVTWMRLPVLNSPDAAADKPPMPTSAEGDTMTFRDALLVRRAGAESEPGRLPRSASSAFSRLSLGSGAAGISRLIGREASSGGESVDSRQSDGPSSQLAEGVGVDARQYVDTLLGLIRHWADSHSSAALA